MEGVTDKLAIILGPTASGKTAVSLLVAQMLGAEIISGDSMQVYRGMDVGTAKISREEMGGITHHLLDIRDPWADFSAADFREEATAAIRDITSRGKLPLIVGGTGLYISTLINPYLFPENSLRDTAFRAQKLAQLQKFGAKYLHDELCSVDPEAAKRIHPHDHHRVVRALEVYKQSGRTISAIQSESRTINPPAWKTALCGLYLRRELLYPRIEQRAETMLAAGLIEEVAGLLKAGVPLEVNSMQGLGYRHIAAYLRGLCTLEEAVFLLKRDTRRFAKRQYTWFKRDPRIRWFDMEDYYDCDHYPHTERLAVDMAAYIRRELGRITDETCRITRDIP